MGNTCSAATTAAALYIFRERDESGGPLGLSLRLLLWDSGMPAACLRRQQPSIAMGYATSKDSSKGNSKGGWNIIQL